MGRKSFIIVAYIVITCMPEIKAAEDYRSAFAE